MRAIEVECGVDGCTWKGRSEQFPHHTCQFQLSHTSGETWSFDKETPPRDVPLKHLSQFCELAQRQDYAYAYPGTLLIRKVLSVDSDPPIRAVRGSGVVPHLVNHLTRAEHSDLQYEAASALNIIMSGGLSQEDKHYVMGLEYCVEYFIFLLESPDESVREQASRAIGNMVGGVQSRDRLLQMGVMGPMLRCVDRATTNISKRNAVRALTKLCDHEPAPAKEYTFQAIPVVAALIQHTDDEVVTNSALWALSYISSDGEEQAVQMVLDQGILPRVVSMLTSTLPAIVYPALLIISNICRGTDRQTQAAIDAGVLATFHFLLKSPKLVISKKAAFSLSNVTAGSQTQIQAVLDADLISAAMDLFDSPFQDIKREAVWVVTNALNGGSLEQRRKIVFNDRLFYRFMGSGVLTSSCVKTLTVALKCINDCLYAGSKIDSTNNPIMKEMIDSGCVDGIESLKAHTDQSVSEAATAILEGYFVSEV